MPVSLSLSVSPDMIFLSTPLYYPRLSFPSQLSNHTQRKYSPTLPLTPRSQHVLPCTMGASGKRSFVLMSREPSGFLLPSSGHKDAGRRQMNGPCILGLQLPVAPGGAPLASPLPASQGFSGRTQAFVTNQTRKPQPSFPFHLQLSCWCFASCSFPQSINN